MPTTKVKGPDGKTYTVNHPEGASQAEVIAYARSQSFKPEKKEDKPAEERLAENSKGHTLQFFNPFGENFDTGIELSPELFQTLTGMGKRFTEIGTLGTNETDQKAKEELATSGYATAGEVIADLASMAAGGSALRGANIIGKAPTLAQTVLGNAAYAGATNEDRGDAALAGGLGGAAGYGAAKVLGKMINPNVTKGAQDVIDDGGVVTPGAILGGKVKAVEDKLTSAPFMGDMITGAQRKSVEQWNKGVINDVLRPIGQTLDDATKAGRDAIEEASRRVSKEYDSILKRMDVRMDRQFIENILVDSGQDPMKKPLSQLVRSLKPEQVKKFDEILTNDVLREFDNPTRLLLGKTFKEVDSTIRGKYKDLYKAGDKKLGNAVKTLHMELLAMAKRQHPELGARLDAADVAYAKLSRVREAARGLSKEDGIFGPSELLRAVQKNTSTPDFAAGRGFDQDAIEAAKKVLPNKYPDSGTAGRIANLAGIGGGIVEPTLVLPALAGAAAYTSPGVKLMQKLLTGGRGATTKAMREVAEQSAPFVGMLGGAVGMQAE